MYGTWTPFTRKGLDTQTLLHTDACTPRPLDTPTRSTCARFYTQNLVHNTIPHTDTFTHRHLYTQTLLHTELFTHRHFYTLHTNTITDRPFYTQALLLTDTFIHRPFDT